MSPLSAPATRPRRAPQTPPTGATTASAASAASAATAATAATAAPGRTQAATDTRRAPSAPASQAALDADDRFWSVIEPLRLGDVRILVPHIRGPLLVGDEALLTRGPAQPPQGSSPHPPAMQLTADLFASNVPMQHVGGLRMRLWDTRFPTRRQTPSRVVVPAALNAQLDRITQVAAVGSTPASVAFYGDHSEASGVAGNLQLIGEVQAPLSAELVGFAQEHVVIGPRRHELVGMFVTQELERDASDPPRPGDPAPFWPESAEYMFWDGRGRRTPIQFVMVQEGQSQTMLARTRATPTAIYQPAFAASFSTAYSLALAAREDDDGGTPGSRAMREAAFAATKVVARQYRLALYAGENGDMRRVDDPEVFDEKTPAELPEPTPPPPAQGIPASNRSAVPETRQECAPCLSLQSRPLTQAHIGAFPYAGGAALAPVLVKPHRFVANAMAGSAIGAAKLFNEGVPIGDDPNFRRSDFLDGGYAVTRAFQPRLGSAWQVPRWDLVSAVYDGHPMKHHVQVVDFAEIARADRQIDFGWQAYDTEYFDHDGNSLGRRRFQGKVQGDLPAELVAFAKPGGVHRPASNFTQLADKVTWSDEWSWQPEKLRSLPNTGTVPGYTTADDAAATGYAGMWQYFAKGVPHGTNPSERVYTFEDGSYVRSKAHRPTLSGPLGGDAWQGYETEYFGPDGTPLARYYHEGEKSAPPGTAIAFGGVPVSRAGDMPNFADYPSDVDWSRWWSWDADLRRPPTSRTDL